MMNDYPITVLSSTYHFFRSSMPLPELIKVYVTAVLWRPRNLEFSFPDRFAQSAASSKVPQVIDHSFFLVPSFPINYLINLAIDAKVSEDPHYHLLSEIPKIKHIDKEDKGHL